MANAPFSGDFESLARQYWNTWNELLGGRGSAIDGWGLAGAMPPGLGRMDPAAYDWYQRMQRLAADFSNGGRAADIASAWRDMLGGQAHAAEPFTAMLRSMQGGLAGGDWLEQMRPLLDMLLRPLRRQSAEWLQRPAFGPAREHQERLQALALAWQQWEERNEAFNAILAQAGQGAFGRFERLLEQHDAPGKRLESARALFDLWIDAAEEAWAEIAVSPEYRHAYAEMTNALMRVRLGLQREVEQFGALLGLPGRSELDALHRKVADLERALHAARRGATKQAARPAQEPSRAAAARAVSAGEGQGDAAASPVAAEPAAAAGVATARSRERKPGAQAKAGKPKAKQGRAEKAAVGKAKGAKAPARKPATGHAVAAKAPSAKAAAARSATAVKRASAGPARKEPVARGAAAASGPASGRQRPDAAQRIATGAPGKRAARGPASTRAAASAPRAATNKARRTPAAKAAGGAARPAPAKAAPAPASARVVSMKDWVSRNLATAQPGVPSGGKARK